jgi:hypothetical protein
MELNDCFRSRQHESACILALLHKSLPHIIDRFYGTLPLPTLSFEPYRLGVLGRYRKADELTPSHSIHTELTQPF